MSKAVFRWWQEEAKFRWYCNFVMWCFQVKLRHKSFFVVTDFTSKILLNWSLVLVVSVRVFLCRPAPFVGRTEDWRRLRLFFSFLLLLLLLQVRQTVTTTVCTTTTALQCTAAAVVAFLLLDTHLGRAKQHLQYSMNIPLSDEHTKPPFSPLRTFGTHLLLPTPERAVRAQSRLLLHTLGTYIALCTEYWVTDIILSHAYE